MLDLKVPISTLAGEQRLDKVRLAVCDIEEGTAWLENARHLPQVFARVADGVVWRAPGTSVDHCVEGTFVKGNIDRVVGHSVHIPYIHFGPADSVGKPHIGVTFRHGFYSHGRKVDAQLLPVSLRG